MKFYILFLLTHILTCLSVFQKLKQFKNSLYVWDESSNKVPIQSLNLQITPRLDSIIFPFKNIFLYHTNRTEERHFWETTYGYNVLESSNIKKFDTMSVEMICSLF